MTLTLLLLVLGFLILIKGADWLVNGSVSLAKHYHISDLAIGHPLCLYVQWKEVYPGQVGIGTTFDVI